MGLLLQLLSASVLLYADGSDFSGQWYRSLNSCQQELHQSLSQSSCVFEIRVTRHGECRAKVLYPLRSDSYFKLPFACQVLKEKNIQVLDQKSGDVIYEGQLKSLSWRPFGETLIVTTAHPLHWFYSR